MGAAVSAPFLSKPRCFPGPTSLVADAPARRRPDGFTLVELLVVVAIITILASLLIPAIAKGRERAKAVKCEANLHQGGTAIAIYSTENNGFIQSYSAITNLVFNNPTVNNSGASVSTMASSLYSEVTHCPLVYDSTIFQTANGKNLVPYADAGVIPPPTVNNLYIAAYPMQMVSVSNPSLTAFACDAAGYGPPPTYGPMTNVTVLSYPSLLATFKTSPPPEFHGCHAGSGSVLWVDGHVSLESPYMPSQSDPDVASYMKKFAYVFHVGYLTPVPSSTPFANFWKMSASIQDAYLQVKR